MHPAAFAILAYLVLGLQLGLGDIVGWGGWGPNLVLIVAAWIAVRASAESALLGPFLLGVTHDLLTPMPLGLLAFTYGIAAVATLRIRKSLIPNAPIVQALITLVFGGLLTVASPTLNRLRGGEPDGPPWTALLVSTILSALLAPLLMPLLERLAEVMGMRRNPRIFD
ncbi:MAG: rod shape-determining protein MreD [Planctomycetota bacterium]